MLMINNVMNNNHDSMKIILESLNKVTLKEYLTQDGDQLADAAQFLNIFSDTLHNPLSEISPEFANNPNWMAVENKYKLIAWGLRGELEKADRVIDQDESDMIDGVWYDGSDSYDIGFAADDLPGIYDDQIAVIQDLIEGPVSDRYF